MLKFMKHRRNWSCSVIARHSRKLWVLIAAWPMSSMPNLVDFKGNDYVLVRGTYVFSLSAVVVKEHTACGSPGISVRSPRASGRRNIHHSMPSQARPAGTQESVVGCQAPAQTTPSRTPSTPSHTRSQACRTGGHASGARKTVSCKTPGKGAYRVRLRRLKSLFRVRRAGKTWLGWLFHVTFGQRRNRLSPFTMHSHMFVSCSTMPPMLVGAAWAAEDEEDPSIIEAKYSFTGAGAAWAASCRDDTTSGVSLAIERPGKSMICSTVCSAKQVTGCADAAYPISGANPALFTDPFRNSLLEDRS